MHPKRKIYFRLPFINLIIYDILLILTPFLMLQHYLQGFVRSISGAGFNFHGMFFSYIFMLFIVVAAIVLFFFLRKINLRKVLSLLVILILMALGQYTADYYIGYKFYDLQNNWHYFAYGIYAFISYRTMTYTEFPLHRILFGIFVSAFFISSCDEGIQVFISNRIFDISDIAKDIWGVLMGIIFIFFVLEKGDILKKGSKIRNLKIIDYYRNPASLILLEGVFAYLLLFVSSILTSAEYWYLIFFITFTSFILIFIIIHFSQIKIIKNTYIIISSLLLLIQTISYLNYRNDNIIYNSKLLTIYKGFIIPYFDIMIFPDGTIRLVDKKKSFNDTDKNVICKAAPDILIIGSGSNGDGGKGFSSTNNVEYPQFCYNPDTKKGMQIIILRTPEACKVFNHLKSMNLKVSFVINNS